MRFLLALTLLLAGCCPPAQIVRTPGPIQYVDRAVERPIDPQLLKQHPIAEGKPSECIAVAAERKKELESCNADKGALRDRSGGDRD